MDKKECNKDRIILKFIKFPEISFVLAIIKVKRGKIFIKFIKSKNKSSMKTVTWCSPDCRYIIFLKTGKPLVSYF